MSHSAWQERLKRIIVPTGYQPYMRRSMQTIVLYEAKRCIAPRLSRLRPFQKRALLMSMVYNILGEIDFMTASDKEAVLWKTQRSREQLEDVTAWKRCKIIQRDLNKLLLEIPRYMAPGRPHSAAVEMMVQAMFNSLNGIDQATASDPRLVPVPSPQWEYHHNHALLTLRVYYHGDTLDPSLPDPSISPFTLSIPSQRPKSDQPPQYQTFRDSSSTNFAQYANRIDTNVPLQSASFSAVANPMILTNNPPQNPFANPAFAAAVAALLPAMAMQPLGPPAPAAASTRDQQQANIPTFLPSNIMPQVYPQGNAAANMIPALAMMLTAAYAAGAAAPVTASTPSSAVDPSMTQSSSSSRIGLQMNHAAFPPPNNRMAPVMDNPHAANTDAAAMLPVGYAAPAC